MPCFRIFLYEEEEITMGNRIPTIMVVHGWNKKRIVRFMFRYRRKGYNQVAIYINRLVRASMILD